MLLAPLVSFRKVVLLALLVPTEGFADTADFQLLNTHLQPLDAASDLGIRGTLPKESEATAPRAWRDEGSARQLRGLVCVEHVFVDDASSEWTLPGRLDARDNARVALAHLQTSASKHGVEIDWRETQISYTTAEEISVEFDEHEWTEAAVRRTSTGQGRFLPVDSCPVKECEQGLAILHVKKPGRSYALPSVAYRDDGVERVVMFLRSLEIKYYGAEEKQEPSGIQVPERPAAFVHELLHVFGAQDMYTPKARLHVAAKRYPDEVMLHSHRSLDSLSISGYTAYHVGWSDEVPPALPVQ